MEAAEAANPKRKKRPRPIAFYVVLAAALYVITQVYSLLAPILLSIILIVLITLAINPVVSRLQTWTGGRKRAAGLLLVGVLALGGLTVWAAAVPLKQAFTNLSEEMPAYWERLQKPLIKMEQQAVLAEEKLQEEVSAEIARETPEKAKTTETEEEVPAAQTAERAPSAPTGSDEGPSKSGSGEKSLRSGILGLIQSVFSQVTGMAFNTTQMLIVLVTVFFGVTFTLMNPRPIFGALFSMVPERHHAQTLTIMERIARFVPRWAMSVVISMLTIGSLFFLLMWPIFGFTDALLLGVIACTLSAIPFLGPLLTLIPALLLAIGVGGMTPVWVLIAYTAVQALESNVIIPLVMSRGMKLHPVAVIFSMLLSVAAFGLLGVLVAAPMVTIFGIMHEELYRKRVLPSVTDEDLDRLAGGALLERQAVKA